MPVCLQLLANVYFGDVCIVNLQRFPFYIEKCFDSRQTNYAVGNYKGFAGGFLVWEKTDPAGRCTRQTKKEMGRW